MTKVCMLTTQHSPKDDRIYYKESKSLKQAGYDVSIICTADENGFVKDMGDKNVLNPNKSKEFEIEGIRIIGIRKPASLIQKAANKINCSRYFNNFVKAGIKQNAAVYHAHEPLSFLIGLKIQQKTGAKVIYDAHEPWKGYSVKDWLIRKTKLKKLKYLITANQITRGDLTTDNHHLMSEVVYNCSPPDIFKPEFNENKLDNIIIVHEGSFLFDRGLKQVIEVIRLLKEDYPDIKFRIVGAAYSKEKAYLQKKIKEYSLENNIEETGWLEYEKVGSRLKDCSIGLIMNTHIETNTLAGPANKFFNYLAYGIAIVAVDLPETTRLLNETQAGITIQHPLPENIYNAIKSLLDDKNALSKYCNNSFKAYNIFNWKSEEEKLLSFYENIVLNNKGMYIR